MSDLVPEGWDVLKICDFAKVTDGAHKTPKYISSGIPFLRVTDMRNKDVFSGKIKFISQQEHNELIKRCKPEKGDILYSKNGTIGITRIVSWDEEFSIFVSLALIKLQSDLVQVKYLAHVLASEIAWKQIKDRSKQGTVTNLHLEEIREFYIPTPPLPEQQKIAAILSSVDEVIEKTQAQINKLKNLKTGMMQELLSPREGQAATINNPQGESKNSLHHTEFKDSKLGRIPSTWEVKTLGELAVFNSGNAFKTVELSDGGFKVVRISNLHKPNFPYWRYDGKIKNSWIVEKGDVLFSWAGVANSINAHRYMGEKALLNQHIYNFKFKTDEMKSWTYQILKSLLPELKRNIEGGAGQLHLTKPFIQAISIICPPAAERENISGCLHAIDDKLTSIALKKNQYQNIKKALMQDLLTGKVRVQVDAA
jgi:type I restriction enzyme S subunit